MLERASSQSERIKVNILISDFTQTFTDTIELELKTERERERERGEI